MIEALQAENADLKKNLGLASSRQNELKVGTASSLTIPDFYHMYIVSAPSSLPLSFSILSFSISPLLPSFLSSSPYLLPPPSSLLLPFSPLITK